MNLNTSKNIALVVLFAFLVNTFGPAPLAHADDFVLPTPGTMVYLSPQFDPPVLKGIKVHPENPFRFDFILDRGDGQLSNDALKNDSRKLIKYFLASLTIPEKDLWVNLSPYEKDRVIPQSFGLTEMGRDLLAEDYILKQITASLIYPEGETGKEFWKRIYDVAEQRFGTTNIPVNIFNKVWIVPEKAVVYENTKAGTAYVVDSKLKVMLEQDYLSLQKHEGISSQVSRGKATNQLGSQIVREVVIPELTKEVNENKNFNQLRQVYNSLILATWYKKKIKDSILSQVYADKNRVAGVNIDDSKETQKIYDQYLRAFKKGVYNYIREEPDPFTHQIFPRKYFSGGVLFTSFAMMSMTHGQPSFLKSVKNMAKLGLITVLLTVASHQVFAQINGLDQPNFSKDEIELLKKADNLKLINALGQKASQGDETAIKKLLIVVNQTKNKGSKRALEILRAIALDKINDPQLLISLEEIGAAKDIDKRLEVLIDQNKVEAATVYLKYLDSPNDIYVKKALNLLYNSIIEGKMPSDSPETLFNQYIKYEEARAALKQLAYTGSRSAASFLVDAGYTDLNSQVLREARDNKDVEESLLFLYAKTKRQDVLQEIIEFIFDDTDQRHKLDIEVNLPNIPGVLPQASAILGSPEFKDKPLPKNQDALRLLLWMGEPRARALLPEVAKAEDDLNKRRDLTNAILKGDAPAVDEFKQRLLDNDENDLMVFLALSLEDSLKPDLRQKMEAAIVENLPRFIDHIPYAKWEDFIEAGKIQYLAPALARIQGKLKAFVLAAALDEASEDDYKKNPPSGDVFQSIDSFNIMCRLAQGYLDHGFDMMDIFKYWLQAEPDIMMGLSLPNMASGIVRKMAMQDTTKVLALLPDDKNKMSFLGMALEAGNATAQEKILEMIEKDQDGYYGFMNLFGFNKSSKNEHVAMVLKTINLRRISFDDRHTPESLYLKPMILAGNISALEFAVKNKEAWPMLENDFDQFPGEANLWVRNQDVSKMDPGLMKIFALDGNQQAVKLVLSKNKEALFKSQDIMRLKDLEGRDFYKLKQRADNYLTVLRIKGIDDFKARIRNADARSSNAEMLSLYMAVLIDAQARFKMFDLMEFKANAREMFLKMNMSIGYLNANSGYEFGYALLLELRNVDELLYVTAHEIGHNVLANQMPVKKSTDGFDAINEYYGDKFADRYLGQKERLKALNDSNFLTSDISDFKTEEEWSQPANEPHQVDRKTKKLFVLMAQKRGLDPFEFFTGEHQKPFEYKGSYDDFNRYFYFSTASDMGLSDDGYNPGLGIRDNLESLFKAYAAAKNKAMFARRPENTGGIDLTPVNNVLQTQNAGEGIKFHMDSAMLKQLQNAPGFVPVVISIEPLRDLKGFLTGVS